jgi:hypothetical protein
MSEWLKEHAWKLTPAARADAHDIPPTHFRSTTSLDVIRFGGRVDYVDLVSSSFVEESLQVLGGIRISIRCSLVAAGEHPVAI